MWIKREFQDLLVKICSEKPALILTGCRQAGKTSLLRKVFPHYNYVSLDIPMIAEQAEESGEQFLEKYPAPLIIDEIQYAPRVFRYLKAAIDNKVRHPFNPPAVGALIPPCSR